MAKQTQAPVRVAILDDYHGVALEWADWSKIKGAKITVFRDHLVEEEKIAARLTPFPVVCIMRERTPFPKSLLARLPNLRCLVTAGTQNRAVDIPAATAQGVRVCGTRNAVLRTTELNWALTLALARRITIEDKAMRAGEWQKTIGTDLIHKTLGVVGLGRLGTRVGDIGKAFGMKVIAWSQNMTPESAEERGAKYVSREELFRTSDVVSINLVLSDRTRHLIGARDIGMMKKTAFLINTARGPIIDEKALIAALQKRQIAGAGLDVFEQEPLPKNHPLLKLDNVVLTPHMGYVTEDTFRVFYRDQAEDVAGYLAGKPVRVINPDVLKRSR